MKVNHVCDDIYNIIGVVITVSVGGVMGRVVRGDIECSNGYIHIIDTVLAQVSHKPL